MIPNNNDNNNTNLFDFTAKAYAHGLSKDESFPIDISGRQIAIEALMEPSLLNESNDQQPKFAIRILDKKTNETISDINLRIIVTFKNQTILDQQFHSLDGIVSANLIPVRDSITHAITSKDPEQHLSQNDRVQVSLTNPVTITSKLLSDGGLYDIAVILEKTSKGIQIDTDKKINLFISIGKTFPFVIKESANNKSNHNNDNGNITLQVKTFYDEIQDFSFKEENSKISFKMPFNWDLNYVNQVLTLHEEIIVPKTYTPLSKVSSFIGTVNGMKIPPNTILIDDYSDQNNRIVHVVITTFKLKEYAKQIADQGGNSYAIFELEPVKTV
ncbi:MAG TPA: hypothetical protein VFU79_00620 [Nitrososphaeraceae archaeon]|nr:hypothetical protein [Nitrososphaeraceae archaeon]